MTLVHQESGPAQPESDQRLAKHPGRQALMRPWATEEISHLDGNDDPEDCPPEMWVCKKKRMLKQMLKKSEHDGLVAKLNPSQTSNDACPPGVWTCSIGKKCSWVCDEVTRIRRNAPDDDEEPENVPLEAEQNVEKTHYL
ncbi:hypothetical protein OS493_033747 [Desmophyllum pertusum]|uniref:Uncharacterized protein n=1 Tax=Desmophyllum pertusum TaxID=174260 RepID=A0A9X0CV05_9CNID|nr:hypothetical protein OS493_033747 [Desmophyllum pertusum]